MGVDIEKGEGIPGIIIEHCFIKGNDVKFINSNEKIRKLAKADCDGIVEYYGLRKKEEIVKEISINKENVNLLIGENVKILAEARPSTAINKELKWTSQNEKIAKVDNNGNIQAIGEGKTEIIVSSVDNPKIIRKISVNVEKYENEETEVELKLADINGDKEINTLDAVILLQAVAKKINLNDTQKSAADVNHDGEINTLDAVRILQFVAKKISTL